VVRMHWKGPHSREAYRFPATMIPKTTGR
jgi:hypothetical protein